MMSRLGQCYVSSKQALLSSGHASYSLMTLELQRTSPLRLPLLGLPPPQHRKLQQMLKWRLPSPQLQSPSCRCLCFLWQASGPLE
jgi:hypothetical protein